MPFKETTENRGFLGGSACFHSVSLTLYLRLKGALVLLIDRLIVLARKHGSGFRSGVPFCDRASLAGAANTLLRVILITGCLPGAALAQNPFFEQRNTAVDAATQTDVGLRSGSLVIAPIPFSNDVIGNGISLGAGYLFTLPGSKPSGVGVATLKTDNGSTGYGGGGLVNFGNGRWTLGLFGGTADVNYTLPVGRLKLPLTQSGKAVDAILGYNVTEQLKIGFNLGYLDTSIGLGTLRVSDFPVDLRPDLDVELVKFSAHATWDTRDNTFYPTTGVLISGKISRAGITDQAFGNLLTISDRSYYKGVASASTYNAIGERGVLAVIASVCGAGRDAPFFDSCGVGFSDGLRGFGTLDNLQNWSASAQVEYRGRVSERFGYVAFAGLGGGGESISAISTKNGGAAAGVGLRYRIAKKFGLDYAVDYAVNDQGEAFLYLSLGQRF